MLRPTTSPSIFSVVPDALYDSANQLNDSKTGAWLVLDLSDGGLFTLPVPRQASLYSELNPRDRWVRHRIDSLAWFLTKRFTIRASVSAHLALDVRMQLLGPEEVLQRGGVEWKAELVETKQIVDERNTASMTQTRASLPNHVVVSSVVPRETGAPSNPGKTEDTVVFSQPQDSVEPAEILASDTINVNPDAGSAPHFPCPKLFLHLVVEETGVPIPPATDLSQSSSAFAPWFQLAETVFGLLASVDEGYERDVATAPIHLTLERLYVGGVPATALSMALPMLVMLLLGWFGVRPLLDDLLPTQGKGGKDE